MALKKIATGLLLVVVLAAAGIAAGWYAKSKASKPPPGVWNSNAIQGTFAGLRVEESDPSTVTLLFLYDLDNRSGRDYRLPNGPDLVVMGRLKSTSSLAPEAEYHLAASAFLPVGNRTRITLQTSQPFHWPTQMDAAAEADFREMVNRSIGDIASFVLFDPSTHYQIELPGSWPAPSQVSPSLR